MIVFKKHFVQLTFNAKVLLGYYDFLHRYAMRPVDEVTIDEPQALNADLIFTALDKIAEIERVALRDSFIDPLIFDESHLLKCRARIPIPRDTFTEIIRALDHPKNQGHPRSPARHKKKRKK